MNKKYKYPIIIIAIIILCFLAIQYAFALELTYPNIPGGPTIGDGVGISLETYIGYIFWFLVVSAGVIGVITIVINSILIMASMGSPVAIGNARKKIFDCILGIVLLMISVIVFQTISPDFINPSVASYGSQGGQLWYRTRTSTPGPIVTTIIDYQAANEREDDIWDTGADLDPGHIFDGAPPGTDALVYICDSSRGGKPLLLWVYDQPYFQIDRTRNASGLGNLRVWELPCTSPDLNNIQPASIMLLFDPFSPNDSSSTIYSYISKIKESGIYYYLTEDCTGISSYVQKESGPIPFYDSDETPTANITRSVKIISGADPKDRYGVILQNGSGMCSELQGGVNLATSNPSLIKRDEGTVCLSVAPSTSTSFDDRYFNPKYGTIFHYRNQTPSSSPAIIFLSKNFKYFLSSSTIDRELWAHRNGENSPPDGSRLGILDYWLWSVDHTASPIGTDPPSTQFTSDAPEFNHCTSNDKTCARSIGLVENKRSYMIVLYSRFRRNLDDKKCKIYYGKKKISLIFDNILDPEKERYIYMINIIPTY